MNLTVNFQKHLGAFSLDMAFSAEGNRIGIFGPSGSGKSTLINLISGLQKPERGTVTINGEVLFDHDRAIDVPVKDRRIGMVFQRPHLFPHFTVKGNLLYGFKRCASTDRKITLESVVDVLKLGHLLGRGIQHLSGGEQQRVGIGRAVLSNPRLLIMDEPLSGLDTKLKFQIIPFLKEVSEAFGIPYLFISHSLLEMRIMTDQVLSISEGQITQQTTTEALARAMMGDSDIGYINLIEVKNPVRRGDLLAVRWGDRDLIISSEADQTEELFELSSRDIILFKRHPEAISARNLLKCRVSNIFETGRRLGIELDCGGEILIAEVVQSAVTDLSIVPGGEIYAAIKATSFRRLS